MADSWSSRRRDSNIAVRPDPCVCHARTCARKIVYFTLPHIEVHLSPSLSLLTIRLFKIQSQTRQKVSFFFLRRSSVNSGGSSLPDPMAFGRLGSSEAASFKCIGSEGRQDLLSPDSSIAITRENVLNFSVSIARALVLCSRVRSYRAKGLFFHIINLFIEQKLRAHPTAF